MTKQKGKYAVLKATALGLAMTTAVGCASTGGKSMAPQQGGAEDLGKIFNTPMTQEEMDNFKVVRSQTDPRSGKYAVVFHTKSGLDVSVVMHAVGHDKQGREFMAIKSGERYITKDGETILRGTEGNLNQGKNGALSSSRNGTQIVVDENGRSSKYKQILGQTQNEINGAVKGMGAWIICNAKKISEKFYGTKAPEIRKEVQTTQGSGQKSEKPKKAMPKVQGKKFEY